MPEGLSCTGCNTWYKTNKLKQGEMCPIIRCGGILIKSPYTDEDIVRLIDQQLKGMRR